MWPVNGEKSERASWQANERMSRQKPKRTGHALKIGQRGRGNTGQSGAGMRDSKSRRRRGEAGSSGCVASFVEQHEQRMKTCRSDHPRREGSIFSQLEGPPTLLSGHMTDIFCGLDAQSDWRPRPRPWSWGCGRGPRMRTERNRLLIELAIGDAWWGESMEAWRGAEAGPPVNWLSRRHEKQPIQGPDRRRSVTPPELQIL